MATVTACRLAPAGPSSARAVGRDGSASPSEILPLRHSSDFRRVLSEGQRRRRGGVTVVGARGAGGETRVGLVVGRSVGGAVTRNRSKRRLRHAIEKISLEQGMDYVIIGDRRVFDVRFEKLTAWLREAVDEIR